MWRWGLKMYEKGLTEILKVLDLTSGFLYIPCHCKNTNTLLQWKQLANLFCLLCCCKPAFQCNVIKYCTQLLNLMCVFCAVMSLSIFVLASFMVWLDRTAQTNVRKWDEKGWKVRSEPYYGEDTTSIYRAYALPTELLWWTCELQL